MKWHKPVFLRSYPLRVDEFFELFKPKNLQHFFLLHTLYCLVSRLQKSQHWEIFSWKKLSYETVSLSSRTENQRTTSSVEIICFQRAGCNNILSSISCWTCAVQWGQPKFGRREAPSWFPVRTPEEWKRAYASARPRIPFRASALKAVSKFGFQLFTLVHIYT